MPSVPPAAIIHRKFRLFWLDGSAVRGSMDQKVRPQWQITRGRPKPGSKSQAQAPESGRAGIDFPIRVIPPTPRIG